MPAKTRSSGQAPANRVYKSSPALQQAIFPGRRKTVTYGRQRTSRAPDSKQQTLTQGGYILPLEMEPIDLLDDEPDPPKKRRKTMGDTPSSSYHTQTLTQLYQSKDESDEMWQVSDSEDKEHPDLDLDLGRKDSDDSPTHDEKRNIQSKSPSVIPQTPTNKQKKTEIPSSQDTPITPMLARYSPAPRRSPLKDRSTNVMSSMPRATGSAKRPRLEIQDSYATTNSLLSTLEKQSSQEVLVPTVKKLRFATPPGRGSMLLGEDLDSQSTTPSPKKRCVPSQREIPDSDDELDDDDETEEVEIDDDDKYDAVGEETQFHMDQLLSSSEKHLEECRANPAVPPINTGTPAGAKASSGALLQVEEPEEPLSFGGLDVHTVELIPYSQEPLAAMAPNPTQAALSSPTAHSAMETQAKTQLYTQGIDSQRVSLDIIRAMAPQTNRSDIFISIHPEHVENIVAGTKNHEFRNYRIPSQVARMWIYVTKPVAELQYMACISHAKEPGEIEDESGLGNADFNTRQMQTKFAYELLEVYELNDPVPLAGMKQNGWLEAPPQKYNYVPPAVVGHLMANLRCSLFGVDGDEGEEEEAAAPTAQVTISQEIADQIRSDNAAQCPSSSHDVVPSSHDSPGLVVQASAPNSSFKRPSLPASATPGRTYTRPSNPTPRRATRPSQATTASQASTPPASPPKSVPRPGECDSSLLLLPEDDGSPIRLPPSNFELASSQLLTKSQMLPDSLLREDRRPVDVIWDSEQDDDDEL